MSDKTLSPRFFQALGAAAAWFFVYVLLHETLVPVLEAGRGEARRDLQLSTPAAEAFEPGTRAQLDASFERGAHAFAKCVICHSEDPGRQRYGPPLYGIFDRGVASLSGGDMAYRYSPTLRKIGDAGALWTVARLWAFIHRPRSFAPDTRMPFPGIVEYGPGDLPPEHEIRDLLHYIAWSCRPHCKDPVLIEIPIEELGDAHWEDDFSCIRDVPPERLARNPGVLIVPEDVAHDCLSADPSGAPAER